MTTTQKSTAEVPLPVYVTAEERDLLRIRAAHLKQSMSRTVRNLIRRELGLEPESTAIPEEFCGTDTPHLNHLWGGSGVPVHRCPGTHATVSELLAAGGSDTVFGIRPHTGRPEDEGLRQRVAEMLPPERTCLDEVPHGPHTWVARLTSIYSCPGVSA